MNRGQPTAYILTKSNKSEIQRTSVHAAKMLAGMIKTCLGPRAMQKIVLTKINTVEHTNDGISILRELDVGYPTARCLIELSQTQDDECGDGTTTVLILAAEVLEKLVKLLDKHHPIRVCKTVNMIKLKLLAFLDTLALENNSTDAEILKVVKAAVATKFCTQIGVPIAEMAFEVAMKIKATDKDRAIDVKNNIKVVKILGDFKECKVVDGIVFDKDIVHSQMAKEFENPKVLLTDCALEYKKGESATNIEISNTEDFTKMLKEEETQIKKMCNLILALKPNMVVCEKGACDLALSILQENGVTCLRRTSKIHLTRIAKATGATIVSRLEDATENHLGTCGKYEYKRIGQDFFSIFSKCKDPRAISVVLCGPTKDINNELERNFMDAIKVAKNMLEDKRVFPGGGATEMVMSVFCSEMGLKTEKQIEKDVCAGIADAFKIVPNILFTNSGERYALEKVNTLFLEQKKTKNYKLGVNGITGEIIDMTQIVCEPYVVKVQCFKSVLDCVVQLLRIDGIVECVKVDNQVEE